LHEPAWHTATRTLVYCMLHLANRRRHASQSGVGSWDRIGCMSLGVSCLACLAVAVCMAQQAHTATPALRPGRLSGEERLHARSPAGPHHGMLTDKPNQQRQPHVPRGTQKNSASDSERMQVPPLTAKEATQAQSSGQGTHMHVSTNQTGHAHHPARRATCAPRSCLQLVTLRQAQNSMASMLCPVRQASLTRSLLWGPCQGKLGRWVSCPPAPAAADLHAAATSKEARHTGQLSSPAPAPSCALETQRPSRPSQRAMRQPPLHVADARTVCSRRRAA